MPVEGVGLEVGEATVGGIDAAPEAAGGGVVTGAAVSVDVVAVAPGVVGVRVDPPNAIASTIKMIITLERLQPFFIISSTSQLGPQSVEAILCHLCLNLRQFHHLMTPFALLFGGHSRAIPR